MWSRGSRQCSGRSVLSILLLLAFVSAGCAEGDAGAAGGASGAAGGAVGAAGHAGATTGTVGAAGRSGAGDRAAPTATQRVRVGAEVLLTDSLHLVRSRRVGLITNHTGSVPAGPGGSDAEVESTIDRLHAHPDVELVALFAPEHSIRGDAAPGEEVRDEVDPRTGLPVHSLYGDTRKPTPEMLEGVGVLVFDVLDVGARYYTYVSTMALAMEAAGEAGIPFVVLDRPNPVDGVHLQGNVLDPAFASFVGMFPVPMRHGMTPGELARLFRGEFDVEVDLRVAPAEGWRPELRYPETGLPWTPPSPNIPSVESAIHYLGTCLFEGTNLSVGRGTERPFQQIGAPWLDGEALARRLNDLGLEGVRFEPVRFTPEAPGDGKYDGVEVSGVRFVETGPAYDPPRTAVAALVEARRQAGERWDWYPGHFDRLAGTDRLREGVEAGRSTEALTAEWPDEVRRFEALRRPYLIYPRPASD